MNKGQDNAVRIEQGIHPAEKHFRRELSLLENDTVRVQRVLDRIMLYTHDIKDLDFEETDGVLLWLVNMLREMIMNKKAQDPQIDSAYRFGRFKFVYNILPIQWKDSKWLFSKTKEEVLRLILSQWKAKECDEHNQEMLTFIWGIYKNERPLEERKVIDKIMLERLNGADPLDIEKWIKWIHGATSKPGFLEEYEYMHEYLARHFVTARTRGSSLNEIWWDIRFREIVDGLNLRHVSNNVLPTLVASIQRQMEVY